jgi:hypothetical protein
MKVRSPEFYPPFLLRSSADRLNQVIEALQETGAVSLVIRGRPTDDVLRVPQESHDISMREGISDGLFREDAPLGVEDPGSLLDATGSKGNVGGYHHVVLGNVFYDPIVSGVQMVIHDYHLGQLVVGNLHSGVGHKIDLQAIATGYPDCFILHGTGVCIYIYVDQRVSFLVSTGGSTAKTDKESAVIRGCRKRNVNPWYLLPFTPRLSYDGMSPQDLSYRRRCLASTWAVSRV